MFDGQIMPWRFLVLYQLQKAMTASDFTVVECACRQMAQKAGAVIGELICKCGRGCRLLKMLLARSWTWFNSVEVLNQKSISNDEKESARGLIAAVDAKVGWETFFMNIL